MKHIFTQFYIALSFFLLGNTINIYAQSGAESDIVITEIFYNQPGTDTLEFIEIFNRGSLPININGYKIDKGISHQFGDLIFRPNSYLVLAKTSQVVNSFFGIAAIQWDSGSLSNGGEKIVIKNSVGIIMDSLTYSDTIPWPNEADGDGPSLVLCDPNSDNGNGANWSNSSTYFKDYENQPIYASPGYANTNCALNTNGALNKVLINIFPNPSNGKFKVSMDNKNLPRKIEILTMLGQTIYSNTFVDEISVDLSRNELLRGLNIIQIKDLSGTLLNRTKIIIE